MYNFVFHMPAKVLFGPGKLHQIWHRVAVIP